MDLHHLLRSLSLAGVELHYGGPGVIGTRAEPDSITPELESGIEEHRQTLLSYLVFAEGDPLEIAERFAIQNELPKDGNYNGQHGTQTKRSGSIDVLRSSRGQAAIASRKGRQDRA